MTSAVQPPAPAIPEGAFGLVAAATPLTQAVLLVLVLLSFVSWTIMFLKWRELARSRRAGHAFLRAFEHATSVDAAATLAAQSEPSHFTRVFDRAMQFLAQTTPALGATADRAPRLSGSQVEALRMVLDTQSDAERDRLSRFVPWLATIGSVSPLLGLLGTVLGVIDAFLGIAREGAGNLGAVAPGVAEALVATAAALAVAIPAVFGYNLFATALNRVGGELDGFGSELIALLVREGRI